MKHLIKQLKTSKAGALIILAWLVYSVSYLGKVNYSANITQIVDYYGITRAQAGIAPTFFFFAYGIGQVVNGILSKKYNIKWMVFTSLIASATINFIIAFSDNFVIIKWLWLVNGFVLSILWPTLIRMLSENLSKNVLATSSIMMGTTVALGTLTIYGLSSIFAVFSKFKLAFYTASLAVFIVAFVWIFSFNKAIKSARDEKEEEDIAQESKVKISAKANIANKERKLLLISIGVLCFYSVGVNLIKDGLNTWVPSILKETFSMSDSLSILLTLFLPVLAIFGNAGALRMHKLIPDFVNQCAVVFAGMALFVGFIIGSFSLGSAVCMLLGLLVVMYLASTLNSLVTSIFPIFMRDKVNSGLMAGVLNGFCYVGSTLSSYGLGTIADSFGWVYVFWTLIAFCVVVIFVWGVYSILKSTSLTYYITPQKAKIKTVTSKKKAITLKWEQQKGKCDFYEIEYSTKSNFADKMTLDVAGKKASITIKNGEIKNKKTYYIRIRSCTMIAGERVYSSWSDVKKVKVKK